MTCHSRRSQGNRTRGVVGPLIDAGADPEARTLQLKAGHLPIRARMLDLPRAFCMFRPGNGETAHVMFASREDSRFVCAHVSTHAHAHAKFDMQVPKSVPMRHIKVPSTHRR